MHRRVGLVWHTFCDTEFRLKESKPGITTPPSPRKGRQEFQFWGLIVLSLAFILGGTVLLVVLLGDNRGSTLTNLLGLLGGGIALLIGILVGGAAIFHRLLLTSVRTLKKNFNFDEN